MKLAALAAVVLASTLVPGCTSGNGDNSATSLVFDSATGDFHFTDASGNRVIYERAENTLIVEPDIDVEELARAFCRAERESDEPARFAAVSLVLAEALVPFIDTVERVCDR